MNARVDPHGLLRRVRRKVSHKSRGRILYLTPGVFDKGGISRYCRYQISALRDLLGDDSTTVLSLLSTDAHSFEIPFEVYMSSSGPNLRGKTLLSFAAAACAFGDRPDIVWSAHAHLTPMAVALARLIRAEVVVNVYGAEVWTNVTRMRAASIRAADFLISDCHATLDHILAERLHRREQTYVHWDCVDLTRFNPGDPGDVLVRYGVPSSPHRMTVLTLARLAADEGHKGVDRLIEVIGHLPADAGVRLVVAGDGTGRQSLESQAAATPNAAHIHFTGRVTEDDLPLIYRACDVFAMVTHKGPGIGEGIPLTPLEAAACEKPIIVGNQDGSREAAVDGESGFILDPFDLDALRERICQLAADEAMRKSMGRRAKERITREHSYERFREHLGAFLRDTSLRE